MISSTPRPAACSLTGPFSPWRLHLRCSPSGTVTARALEPAATQPVDGQDGLARPRPRRRRPFCSSRSVPDDVCAAATITTGLDDFGDDWWEEPFRRLCASLDSEAPPPPARPAAHPRASSSSSCRTACAWSTCGRESRPSCASPCRAPIVVTGLGRSGTTLLHELLACDPDNRPPLLWELLHSVPYEDSVRRPVRRRDHAHGRDGAGLHRHARERRPPPHRVHLRLRPPVLERHVHRSVQRGRVHDVAQRRGPGADLRLAQAPAADAAVGGRAAHDALGRQGALPPVRPAPGLLDLPRCPGRDHPPRSAAASSGHSPISWPPCTTCTRTTSTMPSWSSSWPWVSRCRWTTSRRGANTATSRTARSPTSSTATSWPTLSGSSKGSTPGGDSRSDSEFRASLEAYLAARHTARRSGHDYSFADTGLDLGTHRALVTPYQERFGVPSEVT